MTQKYI